MRCYSKIFNLVSIKVNLIETDWIAIIIETGLVKPATFESDDTSQKFACYIHVQQDENHYFIKVGLVAQLA